MRGNLHLKILKKKLMSSIDNTDSGSIFGGMLLICGSCIGAGMLALPILTGVAGFFPTLIMFVVAWIFMTTTALLIVEVNSSFEKPVNFITMVGRTLGQTGRFFSWLLYLFLFYALLVAYISTSGSHLASFIKQMGFISIPDWFGSVLFVIAFGWVVYFGTRPVDLLNRGLMFGKILSFLGLVFLGMTYIASKHLSYVNVKYSMFSLPVLIISFGFHNMIPSLSQYLGGNVKRIKQSILAGSILTFCIYIVWEIVALGVLPVEGAFGVFDSFKKDIGAAQAIRSYIGFNSFGVFAELLAFFAILTSFLAQSLSLVHFLSDGFCIKRKMQTENIWMCLVTFLPPLIFSILFPQLFYAALNFAGGFCAVILFGVFPALMVWIGRYRHKIPSNYKIIGGQPLLIFILLFALFIVFYQLSNMLGFRIFPKP